MGATCGPLAWGVAGLSRRRAPQRWPPLRLWMVTRARSVWRWWLGAGELGQRRTLWAVNMLTGARRRGAGSRRAGRVMGTLGRRVERLEQGVSGTLHCTCAVVLVTPADSAGDRCPSCGLPGGGALRIVLATVPQWL